jgi:hypothetical protein
LKFLLYKSNFQFLRDKVYRKNLIYIIKIIDNDSKMINNKNNKIRLCDLEHIIKTLNLIYKFNNLVLFIKNCHFEQYFRRSKNIVFLKYPKWDKIFRVLNYFSIYILDEYNKYQYINFIKSYQNNENLKIYYQNLINS